MVEVIASTVADECDWIFRGYYREELLREYAYLRSREVRTKQPNQQIVDSEVHPTYIFSFNVGFTWRNCNSWIATQ
jgi:hypothetical protein